jgi:hypothetical protein
VLYPYGCEDNRTATHEVVEALGQQIASTIPKDSGRGNYAAGTPWELLYNADGGDMDWMYATHNVVAYAIELNTGIIGFQPDYSHRQPTVEKLRGAWSLLLDRLSGSGIRGRITDGAGRGDANASVTLHSLTAFPSPQTMADVTWQVKSDGTFHFVLNPGTYRLTFESQGRRTEREVTVGVQRVDMDVEL